MSSRRFRVLVMTDIVDSTVHLGRVGDARWSVLLAEHRVALRRVARLRGGEYLGHTGDGLLLSFLSPGTALRCAWELVERADALQLAIRVGVHAGEVEQVEDGVGGMGLHVTSRITGWAGSGQVAVSPTVVPLVAGDTLTFDDAGEHRLKGLDPPWRLWLMRPLTPADRVPEVAGPGLLGSRPDTPLPARMSSQPGTGVVGREQERARLASAQKAAFCGDGHRLVLLSGEPGIGKTTLAADLAQRAHGDGATVLYGRCDADLAHPYQPFVEALGGWVKSSGEASLRDVDDEYLSELFRLLPQLRERLPGLPEPPVTDADAQRYLLFGAITGLLTRLAAQAPVVLVLDDLHWADKPTVLLLRHLVAVGEPIGVLIVATYRDSDLTEVHPLTEGLAALWREDNVLRMPIAGLDDVGVISLLENLAGHPMDAEGLALARAVRSETDGNPFFTGEVLRHLSETGAIRHEKGRWVAAVDLAAVGVPDSVHDVVAQRVRRLGSQAQHVLTVASVVGRDFGLFLVAAAAQRSEEQVLGVLEAALAARIVAEVPGGVDRFTFAHALFQRSLYEDLSASRRARTHRRVAESLERDCAGDDLDSRAAELARHWIAAGRHGDWGRAAAHAIRAGQIALRSLAPDEAIRWFRGALDILSDLPAADIGQRLDVLIGLGDAQKQAGEPVYRETLLAALAEATRLGDGERIVAAALANQRGRASNVGTADPERIEMLERALAAVGPAAGRDRAWLLAALAGELTASGDRTRARSVAAEAQSIARTLEDATVLLRVLNLTFIPLRIPDGEADSVAASQEALDLVDVVGDPVAGFWAAVNRVYAMESSADRRGIEAALELAVRCSAQVGQPFLTWWVRLVRGPCVLLFGDADEAERLAEQALAIGLDTGQPDALMMYGANLAGIRWHQGRLSEIIPLIEQGAAANPGLPVFQAALAVMLCESGRAADARPVFDAARGADFHHAAYDWAWLPTTAIWADAAAWLEDVPGAAILYERLAPFESLGVTSGGAYSGTVGAYLARLAVVLGRIDVARRLFARADAQLRTLGAPFWQARNQVEWASMLLRTGLVADAEKAGSLLTEAKATAVTYGCAGVLRRAEERTHIAGR